MERSSSPGRDGRVRCKDAGSARIRSDTGATEDAAARRASAARRHSARFAKPSYAVRISSSSSRKESSSLRPAASTRARFSQREEPEIHAVRDHGAAACAPHRSRAPRRPRHVREAPLGDALQHRAHARIVGAGTERGLDPTAARVGERRREQSAQPFACVRDFGDVCDHRLGPRALPELDCSLDQRTAVREVPVEASFDAPTFGASASTATAPTPPSAIASSAACAQSSGCSLRAATGTRYDVAAPTSSARRSRRRPTRAGPDVRVPPGRRAAPRARRDRVAAG